LQISENAADLSLGEKPTESIGYNIRTTPHTLIQSLMQVGGLLASIFIFTLGSGISRRLGLWIASAFSLVAVSVQIGTTSFAGLYLGRLLLGVSNGFYLTYSVTYMGEIAPVSIRGALIGLVTFQTSFGALVGILVDNYTETYFNRLSYQVPLAVMFAIPAMLSAALIFLRDTPRYYVSIDREDLASSSIRQLRGIKDESQLRNEVTEIHAEWTAERELHQNVHFRDAFRGSDLRRTMITIGTGIAQTATGIIFMAAFSVYFFVQADIGEPFKWVMISLAIAITGNLAAFPAMRWINFRPMLVIGSLVSGASMLGMGIVYTVSPVGSPEAGKALVGLSILFTWVYGFAQGPVLWAIQTEIPAQRLRSQTVGLAQGCNFIFAWLCTYCTPYFVNPDSLGWGPKYCYIWAGSNFMLAIWAFLFVPETRGRSIRQIDEIFSSKISALKSSRSISANGLSNRDGMIRAELGKESDVVQLEHVTER
jgi:MFS family permease